MGTVGAGVGGLAIVGLSGGCFDLDLWDTNSRDLRIQHKWIQVGSIRPDNRSRLWIHADLHEECTLLHRSEDAIECDHLSYVHLTGCTIPKPEKETISISGLHLDNFFQHGVTLISALGTRFAAWTLLAPSTDEWLQTTTVSGCRGHRLSAPTQLTWLPAPCDWLPSRGASQTRA